jgi:hypothetical protein
MPVRAWLLGAAVAGLLPLGGLAPAAAAEPVITPPRMGPQSGDYSECYPIGSRQFGREGRIVVDIVIQPDGSVSELHFPAGAESWQKTAAECMVRQMKFIPGAVDGRPVEAQASLPINFSLVGSSGKAPAMDWPELRSDAGEVQAAYRDCYPPGFATEQVSVYRFTVGVDGRTRGIKLLESGGDVALDDAGRCIIGKLRFRPLLRGDQAIKSTLSWPLRVAPPNQVSGP